jgi:hypothetical protein
MATSARKLVAPPSFTPPPVGLSLVDAVTWRDDSHWQAGIAWQDICDPEGASTYDECVLQNAFGLDAPAEPPAKALTAVRSMWGATPFTLFEEVDCSSVGFYEDSTDEVRRAFEESEQRRLENVFWTGTVAGTANLQFPHLAASGALGTTEANGFFTQLQLATTVVTGTALCAEVALGMIEAAFRNCSRGAGILHVPVGLIPILDEAYLLNKVDGKLFTTNGNRIVVGSGYPGTAPDGSTTPGALWIYITPQIFGYRSDVRTFKREETLDRAVNTVKAIAERSYVLAYDCCLLAIPVSTMCGM